jgi:hypothetical protein
VEVVHSQVQNPEVNMHMEDQILEVIKMSLKLKIDKTLENSQRTFSKGECECGREWIRLTRFYISFRQ